MRCATGFAPVLSLGLAVLSGVSAAPADITIPPIDIIDWWLKQNFACPLWKGTLPVGAHSATCNNVFTRTYSQGTTTARFYQVPGTWTSDARYSEIVNGIDAAIKKGMNLFGSFAGPLTINVGLLSGLLGDRVQTDIDNNVKTPCHILVGYPPSYNHVPLLAIQKDVIRNMYYCVEQFYHPAMSAPTDGNRWWRRGLARYFDGVAYPFAAAIADYGLYPEEYAYGIPLYQNDEAAAAFFHYADAQGGWSPATANNWVKSHASTASYDAERAALAADSTLTPLWHGFVLAFVDGTLTYPGGQKIANRAGALPKTTYDLVNLASGASSSQTFGVDSWKGKRMIFPLKAGQKMRVSMELDAGLEWSIRKEGATAWNSGARGRKFDAAAAAGANTNYEIVVSSTRNDAGGFYGKVLMTRIA